MEKFFRQAMYGAAMGICIGAVLVGTALFKAWPRGLMDDPGLVMTMVLVITAIPFIILTTVVGVIVGMVFEFGRRIIVRRKQNQEEPFHYEDRD